MGGAPVIDSCTLSTRDLHQRRTLKFGQLLVPTTKRHQVAFAVRARTQVFDQDQILREFDRVEAKRVGLACPTHGGKRFVRAHKRYRPVEDAPVKVREDHLTPRGGRTNMATRKGSLARWLIGIALPGC